MRAALVDFVFSRALISCLPRPRTRRRSRLRLSSGLRRCRPVPASAPGVGPAPGAPGVRLRRLVHLLGQLVRSLGQRFARLVHARLVVRLQRLLGIGQRVLNLAAFGARDLIALTPSASSRSGRPWSRAGSWLRSIRAAPCLQPSARRLPSPCARLLPSTGRKTT